MHRHLNNCFLIFNIVGSVLDNIQKYIDMIAPGIFCHQVIMLNCTLMYTCVYLHHTVCLEILFRFERDNSPASTRILHFIINCTSQLFLISQNMLDFKRFVLSAFFRFYPDNSLLIDRNNHNSKLHFKRDEIVLSIVLPNAKGNTKLIYSRISI